MKLADKIITLRKQKGWSQEELAARMDVSRQSVSKWESDQSVPDIDKIILLSQLFGTSTDYLLKEDDTIQADTQVENDIDKPELTKRHLTKNDVDEFIDTRKTAAPKIAFATWLCVLSPAIMMVLIGLSQAKNSIIGEKMSVAIGLGALLVIVTIAVAIFIVNGIKLSKYEYMEKEVILLDRDVYDEVNSQNDEYMPKFSKNIAIGVVLCIVSVVPLIVFSMLGNEVMTVVCVGVLLAIVACGVYLFVKSSYMKGSYDQLLQKNDFSPKKKMANNKLSGFESIYWLSVTAVYLLVSFLTGQWGITWIIWVIAGIVNAIIYVAVENKQ